MLSLQDIDNARSATPGDVCFTARVLAGKVISYLNENPGAEVVHVPRVCIKCLEESVPTMVELATGKTPEYVWEDDLSSLDNGSLGLEDVRSSKEKLVESQMDTASDRPKVGILGNALHCFEPLMNDNLASLLKQLGCEPILPQAQALYSDNVQYKDQLQDFLEQGVTDVIYIQSFGCTKANVQVRGQIHKLKQEFPDIRITVIDYDPDSSELNRENRIRLAVEAASKR